MLFSSDYNKLFSVGSKVKLPLKNGKMRVGKILDTSVLDYERKYLISWSNGVTTWVPQAFVRTLILN